MGSCTSSAASSGGARRRVAVDYDAVASLWEALASGDVLLVRGSWLVAHAERGGVLPRRQECPAEAFIHLPELQDIYEKSHAKRRFSDDAKRAPVFALSHFWRAREHPDGGGETLRTLGRALRERMPQYREFGLSDVGMFLDWCSLYQSPRSEAEEQSFGKSLAWINLWYSHALTTVYLVTDAPEGVLAYHERGWTSFEYQLSWLIKKADRYNVWPQVVDLGCQARSRPALAPPDAFRPGRAFGSKTYTNGADREKVARKFEETCQDVFNCATQLDFSELGWGDAEAAALRAVLPLCRQLEELVLNDNPLTHLPESLSDLGALRRFCLSDCAGLAALPESLGRLENLQTLYLDGCAGLAALPESLGRLENLQRLHLRGCAGLAALPESLGRLANLQTLHLGGCAGLAALPESLGRLANLQTLHLGWCAGLAALPESLGRLANLQTLDLSGCAGLAALPESLGRLANLQTLDLSGCAGLAALPESLGRLANLQRLHLSGCAGLAALPESLGRLANLQRLHLVDCAVLAALPESLGRLEQQGCSVFR